MLSTAATRESVVQRVVVALEQLSTSSTGVAIALQYQLSQSCGDGFRCHIRSPYERMHLMDIESFIHARLDEDAHASEGIREGGFEHPTWHSRPTRSGRWMEIYAKERLIGEPPEAEVSHGAVIGFASRDRNEDTHITRYDPARMMRTIEAKRQLLSHHKSIRPLDVSDKTQGTCATCADWDHEQRYEGHSWIPGLPWPCPTVRLLAAEWSYHPNYYPGWNLG